MTGCGRRIWGYKQESSFSEEKEAKRLSPFCSGAKGKSFLVLFFKKEHAYVMASTISAFEGNTPVLRLE
jgi:hypothetical protein